MRIWSVCLVVLAACAPMATAVEPQTASPIPSLPASLADLEARDAGTDHLGNLWAWQGDEVKVYAPSGEVVAVFPVPAGTAAVDADREWGLIALAGSGRAVLWARPHQPSRRLPLPDEMVDVAWTGRDELAASPARTNHRAEVWSLELGARVAAFGEEAPFAPPGPGAYLLRAVLLEHDHSRDRLWALDSFTGDLQVFAADGTRVARAKVHNPKAKEIEEWLRQDDVAARKSGEVKPSRYVVLRLGLDEKGDGRVVTECSTDRRTASLVTIAAGGRAVASQVPLDEPCCSRAFATWHEQLIFYASSGVSGELCATMRRIP